MKVGRAASDGVGEGVGASGGVGSATAAGRYGGGGGHSGGGGLTGLGRRGRGGGARYIKAGFSLATGAAVHFWYDFALGTISFIADPDHQPFVVHYGMPF